MGARHGYLSSLTKEAWMTLESHEINVGLAASASSMLVGGGANTGTTVGKEQAQEYSKTLSGSKSISLGKSPLLTGGDAVSWARDAEAEPMAIKYTLKPINEVFEKSNLYVDSLAKRDWVKIQFNMNQGLFDYCVSLKEEGKLLTCEKPSADTPVPKLVPGDCRLCSNCGGEFSSEAGASGMNTVWPKNIVQYGQNCGENYGSYGYLTSVGVKLCCKPESGYLQTSCKQCNNGCNNEYIYAGAIMTSSVGNNFFTQYDTGCKGDIQQRNIPHMTLCCKYFNYKPLCTYCTSCGGSWKKEVGMYAADTVQLDFLAKGSLCSGDIAFLKGIGMKVCCQ